MLRALAVMCGLVLAGGGLGARAETVWMEGESPTNVTPATYTLPAVAFGTPGYLSGGKWAYINVDDKDVEKSVPADGITLKYNFNVTKEGTFAVWDRVGFEGVRSPFEWRVDDGKWSTLTAADPTVDAEELSTWVPVAWLKLGNSALSAGPHAVEIRVTRAKNAKGAFDSVKYCSDALCITSDVFHPDGTLKPGDKSWQTPADVAAAANVFKVTVPAAAAQTSFSLAGNWQYASFDEAPVVNRTGATDAIPALDEFNWRGIPIPSNRNDALKEKEFNHRYLLRARVDVPAELAGRALYMHFPGISAIGTLFVNGRQVGWTKAMYALWDVDITRAVKFGQVNDVVLVIKDPLYAHTDADKTGRVFYMPWGFLHYTTEHYDLPVLGHEQENGILRTPSIVVAGKAYTSDVFAMPSVQNKRLGLEVTVHNPTNADVTVKIDNDIVPLAGGKAEKSFASKEVEVAAGQDAVVKLSEFWENPRLWWPDDPQQYNVVTRLSVNGTATDERTTKFGFREWTWNGPNFKLNGVAFHGFADLFDYNRADAEAVKAWRAHGQSYQRVWGEGKMSGLETPDALDFLDANGIPVRRTGIFDGEGAAGFYNIRGNYTDNGKAADDYNRPLFNNWFTQLQAWVKGQRNHPSIFVWSMENEITFINAHVTGNDDIVAPAMKKASDLLAAIDPTRPQMVDGGNALKNESLPVYGGHYMEPPMNTLPEGAYDKAGFKNRQVWPVTQQKPILLGEAYFASGYELADLATVGGEAAFVGKAEAHPSMGLTAKMFSEGYRWNDVNFHFWFGGESDIHYNSWQPLAVLVRQWESAFGSGATVHRTLGIFNNTRFGGPVTLKQSLLFNGKSVWNSSKSYTVPAGENVKFDSSMTMPATPDRMDGTWTLSLVRNGKTVFTDKRPVSVLNTGSTARFYRRPTHTGGGSGGVAVFDPSGVVQQFLQSRGISITSLTSLSGLPANRVLVIGKDALDIATSTSSRLAAWTTSGHVLIVLEQKNPLKFQALPGEMSTDTNRGSIAFIEDTENPIIKGLQSRDFLAWGADNIVYQNAYNKPSSGGKSVIQCDNRLADSALAQMQADKGLMLLSQLQIATKLNSSAVAQRLLLNMVHYGQNYKQQFRAVKTATGGNTPLANAVKAIGLKAQPVADALNAISTPGTIAVVDGSAANLKLLAGNMGRVQSFTNGGGWLLLNNVGPDGLADYNKLVGVNHIMRPYGREKVQWPLVRSPLTAGLATSNIVMGSGQQIFWFAAGQYPDEQAFSNVVDLEDVAPFGHSTFSSYGNITNNFLGADGWPLIINFPAPKDGTPFDIEIDLPRAETITHWTWIGNNNYNPTDKVALIFNHNTNNMQVFDVKGSDQPMSFDIAEPVAATHVTMQIQKYQNLPGKSGNIGIDNIYLYAKRPADYKQKVKPMLNIGAMVEYPKGSGGIVLCNVRFKDQEAVPENKGKKQTILATVLRNLNAPFSGGSSIIAGTALNYAPVDISKQANQYRGAQGWFGDKDHTFAELPTDKQVFAGVPYVVYNFTTSPVPSAIMLGGGGIPHNLPDAVRGISVNKKADALFFLQAARIDNGRNDDDRRNKRYFEIARYVVTYADGQKVTVPVRMDYEIASYRQTGTPTPLPNAQIAWTKPYSGSDIAVAYSMQWNNPRPTVEIKSVDLEYGNDRRGVPALLALTAATK